MRVVFRAGLWFSLLTGIVRAFFSENSWYISSTLDQARCGRAIVKLVQEDYCSGVKTSKLF